MQSYNVLNVQVLNFIITDTSGKRFLDKRIAFYYQEKERSEGKTLQMLLCK